MHLLIGNYDTRVKNRPPEMEGGFNYFTSKQILPLHHRAEFVGIIVIPRSA